MSGSYLYCPTPGCGEYLGSLGGDSCRHCGWSAGRPRRFDDDWAPNPNDDQGEPARGVNVGPAPDITDEELGRRFTRCAYPGPNPMYRCNGCGHEEYGVRNLLLEHAAACGVGGGRGKTFSAQTPMEDTSSGKTVGEG